MILHNFINGSEQRDRDRWFAFSVIGFICSIFFDFLWCFLSIMNSFASIVNIVECLVLWFLLYRCAYKKPGTRFLTFWMIMQLVVLLKMVELMPIILAKSDFFVLNLCLAPIGFVFVVVGFCLNFKLRKINVRIKNEIAMSRRQVLNSDPPA
jgi:hypothetical protein